MIKTLWVKRWLLYDMKAYSLLASLVCVKDDVIINRECVFTASAELDNTYAEKDYSIDSWSKAFLGRMEFRGATHSILKSEYGSDYYESDILNSQDVFIDAPANYWLAQMICKMHKGTGLTMIYKSMILDDTLYKDVVASIAAIRKRLETVY